MHSMTYGVMPTYEQFSDAWDKLDQEGELRNSEFHFGNDQRLGTCALNKSELWDALQQAHREYEIELEDDSDEDPEVTGSWLSCVLGCLGFEWI